jgi:HEAT repeat protein
MKTLDRMVYGAALGITLLGVALNLQATPAASPGTPYKTDKDKAEAELIQDLAPTNSDRVITDAMTQLERMHNHDANVTNSIPALVNLLTDNRSPVRRKAARVLGVFHAPLSETEIRLVCRQLQATDWGEVQSGVKALRDLHATSAVPDLLPLLQHSNSSVVRDTCRALAVLGDKSVIPSIEPLLKSSKASVVKDAQAAITTLKAKP